MNNLIAKLRNLAKGKTEHGLTMIEITVAIVLLGIIMLFTTTTILSTTQTSDNFTQSAQSESNLLDAMSLISRDVSLAKSFNYADTQSLSITTLDSNTESQVYYILWNPSTSNQGIPSDSSFDTLRANTSKLPKEAGLVEYRVVNGNTSNPIVRNLIPNYNPGGSSDSLFTYFNVEGKEILLEAGTEPKVSKDNLAGVRRVEMHFTSFVESRSNAMEMHTSAVPKLMGIVSKTEQGNLKTDANRLPPPELNGNLVPKTNTANLWWSPVAGADSYQIFSLKDNATSYTPLRTVDPRSGIIREDHTGLTWGSDYRYKVVAYDHRGASIDSNVVHLRVTPNPTEFDNIEPLRGMDGQSITNYTVARNLQNSLYWKKVNGNNTEYKIRTSENNESWNVLWNDLKLQTNIEGGKEYGDETQYTATSYNDIIAVVNPDGTTFSTGGEAPQSDPVKLISPPIAPELNVTAINDIIKNDPSITAPTNNVQVSNSSSIKTEKEFEFFVADTNNFGQSYSLLKKNADTTSFVDNMKEHSSYDNNKGWGTNSYYFAIASNDAGDSPVSKATKNEAKQHPGPFKFTNLSNNEGYANFYSKDTEIDAAQTLKQVGKMSGEWEKSLGAGSYEMKRRISREISTGNILREMKDQNTGKIVDFESPKNFNGNTRTFEVAGTSPGVVYTVSMDAVSSVNGLKRPTSSTLLTRPDIPRSGYLEAMCLADGTVGNNQTHGMYVNADTRPKYGYADKIEVEYLNSSGITPPSTSRDLSPGDTDNLGFFWQPLTQIGNVGTIKLNTIITEKEVPNSSIDFGKTQSERRSETPYLSVSMLSNFNAPCQFGYEYAGPNVLGTEGNAVKWKDSTNGSRWIVHQFVCYGYVPGRAYGDFWVLDGKEFKKGYSTAQKNEYSGSGSFSRKWDFIPTDGCIWRLDPYGAEPYFQSY